MTLKERLGAKGAASASRWRRLVLVLVALHLGCSTSRPSDAACSFLEVGAAIFGGEGETALALTPEQSRALVLLVDLWDDPVCSGTLITPHAVVTAKHCLLRAPLALHLGPDHRVEPDRTERHPSLDLAVLEFDAPIPPQLAVPIELSNTPLETSDNRAVIAGYGVTESLSVGSLEFAFVEVSHTELDRYITTAFGTGGACAGDSGGPLLWRDADGAVRVFGVLSGGSASCEGEDEYVRLDTDYWMQRYQKEPPQVDCNALPDDGYCFARKSAVWCEQAVPVVQTCRSDERCGWSRAAGGVRCVRESEDACGGVQESGRCEGDVAVWCEAGERRQRECSMCGGRCVRSSDDGRVRCE